MGIKYKLKDLECKYCKASNKGNYQKIEILDLGGRKCKLRCNCGAETNIKETVQEAINTWMKGEYEL